VTERKPEVKVSPEIVPVTLIVPGGTELVP
jgi:hypothetical protein